MLKLLLLQCFERLGTTDITLTTSDLCLTTENVRKQKHWPLIFHHEWQTRNIHQKYVEFVCLLSLLLRQQTDFI